jgi:hypothetical protein
MPLQSFCTVGKLFGGQWMGGCGAVDGNKFVCLDKLYGDVMSGRCLIYSFGIAGDWTFEESMAQLGCTVRAFDPTINGEGKPASDLVSTHFYKIRQYVFREFDIFCRKPNYQKIGQFGFRQKNLVHSCNTMYVLAFQ